MFTILIRSNASMKSFVRIKFGCYDYTPVDRLIVLVIEETQNPSMIQVLDTPTPKMTRTGLFSTRYNPRRMHAGCTLSERTHEQNSTAAVS